MRVSRRGRGLLAAVVVLGLLAAACGRDDEEPESAPETTAEDGGGGEQAAGSFGDLEEVCSDGEGGGDTAQGVTSDEIAISTFSDAGFTGRPGLNQELFDAAEVFAAWCNEAGGINGREIVVHERDAKLTEVQQRMTEACREDFMMVGGGAVFDETGEETRLECLLPNIAGYVVSPTARAADLVVQPVPNPIDQVTSAGLVYIAERFPDTLENVGYLTGSVAATQGVKAQFQEASEQLGFQDVYESEYNPVGESSWTPFAQAMQENGVQGLEWTGEPENLAKLLQAVEDIGYELEWVFTAANHLDQRLIEIGGSAVRTVIIPGGVVPYDRADENEATQQYIDLFEEYLPDGKVEAYLGNQAFSAWLLFAQSAKECGAELTRRCVFDNASAVTEWTGGGLHSATNPAETQLSECSLITEATPEGFIVPDDFEPNEGIFNCSPDNVATLEGDYGQGATLESVGKSIDDLE